MPWNETSTMDQKRLFIKDYLRANEVRLHLSRQYAGAHSWRHGRDTAAWHTVTVASQSGAWGGVWTS